MTSRLAVFLVGLSAFAAGTGPAAHAQGQNNYGSIYSRYGLGERFDYSSSQSEMLGGASVSLRDGSYTGLTNPSLWADQTVTTFSASVGVAGLRATDASTTEASRATAGDVAGLQLGFPILPARLGVALAYRPYSRVRYRSATPGTFFSPIDTTGYTVNREGDGGLQRISAGLGARLGAGIQVGASADVIFGTFEYLQRTEFDRSSIYLETRQAQATQVRGVTATFGAAGTARHLAGEGDALTVAGAITLPTSLSGSRTFTLGESLDRDTLASVTDGSMTLPLLARAGLTYRSGARWLLSADALYEPWSSFSSTLPVGGFEPATGTTAEQSLLQDRFRVGGGFEVTPAGGSRNAGLLRRASYRIGAYGERGLVAPQASATATEGTDVMTYALTGGVSLPNRITGARLDLGVEVGTRGSTEGVLVRDSFIRGTFTLNFGERWFIRRRFD